MSAVSETADANWSKKVTNRKGVTLKLQMSNLVASGSFSSVTSLRTLDWWLIRSRHLTEYGCSFRVGLAAKGFGCRFGALTAGQLTGHSDKRDG